MFNPAVSLFIFVIILMDLPLMLRIPSTNLSDQIISYLISYILDVNWICQYWTYFTSSVASWLSIFCLAKWLMLVLIFFRSFYVASWILILIKQRSINYYWILICLWIFPKSKISQQKFSYYFAKLDNHQKLSLIIRFH